ncbi:MAG: sugar transferase [Acidobacteriota bacterium]
MLKEQARALALGVFTLDLSLVAMAFFVAHGMRAHVLPALFPARFPFAFYPLTAYLPLLPLALLIWGALLAASDRYRSQRTVPLTDEALAVLRVCATGTAILALTIYVLRLDRHLLGDDDVSRLWLALFGVAAGVLLVAEKLALRILSRYVRSKGFNYRTVLIVGTHPQAIALADSIRGHRYWGYKVLGFVSMTAAAARDGGRPPALAAPYVLFGDMDDLPRIVEEQVVDDVVFCGGHRDLHRFEDLFLLLQEQGIRTRFALDLFPHARAQARMEELDGVPLLTFSTAPERLIDLVSKRGLDIGISLLLLMLALPLLPLIALGIKLTSRGAVFYRQTRCGLNGRRFTLYKFRTMVDGADTQQAALRHLNEMDGPVFKLTRDPRVTPLGRVLRKFSLDELPQLWNVLRGDMSLVGPRPPVPDEVRQYQRWQRRRLSMKPGLTCLWQISGRNQIDFERWMRLDLEYIDTWSPWLDLKILWKTVPAVLSGRGAS